MKWQDAKDNFKKFIHTMESPMVFLMDTTDEVHANHVLKFEVSLKKDKYLAHSSVFNLSDEYFDDIEKCGLLFMKSKPSFNNTGHIGWFVIDTKEK